MLEVTKIIIKYFASESDTFVKKKFVILKNFLSGLINLLKVKK